LNFSLSADTILFDESGAGVIGGGVGGGGGGGRGVGGGSSNNSAGGNSVMSEIEFGLGYKSAYQHVAAQVTGRDGALGKSNLQRVCECDYVCISVCLHCDVYMYICQYVLLDK